MGHGDDCATVPRSHTSSGITLQQACRSKEHFAIVSEPPSKKQSVERMPYERLDGEVWTWQSPDAPKGILHQCLHKGLGFRLYERACWFSRTWYPRAKPKSYSTHHPPVSCAATAFIGDDTCIITHFLTYRDFSCTSCW